jgi:hypothetical protein
MDRFHSKLVSFLLPAQNILVYTNTLSYYRISKLQIRKFNSTCSRCKNYELCVSLPKWSTCDVPSGRAKNYDGVKRSSLLGQRVDQSFNCRQEVAAFQSNHELYLRLPSGKVRCRITRRPFQKIILRTSYDHSYNSGALS